MQSVELPVASSQGDSLKVYINLKAIIIVHCVGLSGCFSLSLKTLFQEHT